MVLGFAVGSVPFAVLLGRVFARADIRNYGDGNPGATNAWRAAGWKVGLLAVFLEFSKGFLPVLLAGYLGHLSGWGLALVAISPPLGHAFSPFLGFKGGKAVAASFGMWTALAGLQGFLALGISMGLFYLVLSVDAWTVVGGYFLCTLYMILAGADLSVIVCLILNAALVIYKHGPELKAGIHTRPFIANIGRRNP